MKTFSKLITETNFQHLKLAFLLATLALTFSISPLAEAENINMKFCPSPTVSLGKGINYDINNRLELFIWRTGEPQSTAIPLVGIPGTNETTVEAILAWKDLLNTAAMMKRAVQIVFEITPFQYSTDSNKLGKQIWDITGPLPPSDFKCGGN